MTVFRFFKIFNLHPCLYNDMEIKYASDLSYVQKCVGQTRQLHLF